MNNFSKLFLGGLLALVPVSAQTILLPTTLSTAILSSNSRTIVVASATGFTAGSTVAYVDRELMDVLAVSSTTITVRRGAGGTSAAPHASGAYVFVAAPNFFFTSTPQGSCTRTKELVLPRFDVKSGTVSDCLGGQWIPADIPSGTLTSARFRYESPAAGATAYTTINTNGTTVGATTLYCTELYLPTTKLLTGIALLNGTTVGTDSQYVILYDSAGNLLANSAVAGTLTAGPSVYQERSFTSKYFAVGPAQYFACAQSNTGTDSLRMAITGINGNLLTKGQTGVVYGTIPALTVPTTFNSAVGPYVYVF